MLVPSRRNVGTDREKKDKSTKDNPKSPANELNRGT